MNDDGGLQPGERLAHAVVDAGGEGEVLGRWPAVDAERARLGVDLRVVVGAADQRPRALAGADGPAFEV